MPERESFKQVYVFTVHITIVIPLKVLVSQGCDLKKDYLASYPFSFTSWGKKKSKWWSSTFLHLLLSPKNILKLSHMITYFMYKSFKFLKSTS